jgi:putative heme iron utilization protein
VTPLKEKGRNFMQQQMNLDVKKERYLKFINECKTIVISSIDEVGDPFISYAPFVIIEDDFYIFISKISDHYKNIENNTYISIMMLSDESKSPNLFARERVRFKCTSKNIGNEDKEEIFAKFEEIHGAPMMSLLKNIDMSLFKLKPIEGRYVVGFGQAFEVDLIGDKFTQVIVDRENR